MPDIKSDHKKIKNTEQRFAFEFLAVYLFESVKIEGEKL